MGLFYGAAVRALYDIGKVAYDDMHSKLYEGARRQMIMIKEEDYYLWNT